MEKLGAYKVVDWDCYRIKVPKKGDERLARIAEYVRRKNGYEIADVYSLSKKRDKTDLKNLMIGCLDVLDEAFSDLYGTSPLNYKQKKREVETLTQVFLPELACAVMKDGKVICYGFCIPSLLKVLQKGRGHIIPCGLIPFIKAMTHPKVADMMSVGVAKEHQNLGGVSIVLNEILNGCIRLGVEYLETGPELETNRNVQNLWKNYERELVKRHRCWGIKVSDLKKVLN